MIHCVRAEKLRADRLREVLRPDNPTSMVCLEETIDLFYKEVSSAFHPLAAFC